MKRKQDTDQETLAKLGQNIEKLLSAAERLAGAADYSRRQIDRLAQLVNRVEDLLRRGNKPGISIEGEPSDLGGDSAGGDSAGGDDSQYDQGRPLNIDSEEPAEDYNVDFGFGHFVEFSSYEELKKFQKLPPISGDEIELCDFDDTIRHLLSDETAI